MGDPVGQDVLGSGSRPAHLINYVAGLLFTTTVLFAVSFYSYPIFHVLVEMFSVVIAASVFIVVFHTRRLLDNDYLLFVGIGFLFFTMLGVPHMLAYQGIQLFHGYGNDLPTQAFIAQRFLLASTFMLAPAFLRHRLWLKTTLAMFAALTVLVLLSLLVWRNFPHMLTPTGLTPVKRQLEFVLSVMFVASGIGLVQHHRWFDRTVLRLLVASLACFVASEVSFSFYETPFSGLNLIGHLFQVAAFYFTYRAVLVTGLANPFGLLFRELANREQRLSAANARLNAVADISDTAMSSLDLQRLVPALLSKVMAVLQADAGAMLLAQGDKLVLHSAPGFDVESLTLSVGPGFSGGIAASRQSRYLADVQADSEPANDALRAQGIRSVLGVPMLVGDTLIGVLHVDWRHPRPYVESDARLLEIAADRIALSLRNAQAYENERRIAQMFQESLLSLPERVAGVHYARVYHSATEEASVGGDFFDLFEAAPGVIGIVIGDVSGKGIEAAVLTSLVKDAIKAHAHEGNRPAHVLRLTNSLVERYTRPETFVTVFFGLLYLGRGSIVYSSAGHLPVFVLRPEGTIESLPPTSPLLGAIMGARFEEREASVQAGETLVLYTDGVIEARGASGELYGEARLLRSLEGEREATPQAVVDRVLGDLLQFTGGKLSDDLAILTVKRDEADV